MEQEQILIDVKDALCKFPIKFPGVYTTFEIHEMVEECATVDAVPVVRCGECSFWNNRLTGFGSEQVCRRWSDIGRISNYTEPNDFCSYGEPKTP